jgi:succinate dehydrogenase / fumarate reductase cytochrome b subunit
MANIFTSSIGKKVIMSISGLFLILFLLLHMSLNFTSIFSEETFRQVCDFMALPIVSILVPLLAFGFIIHIVYAFILTLSNLRARGGYNRYAVPNKAPTDSWASRNMIVLGIIVVLGLVLHLTHFWADMQLAEWMGKESANPNELMTATFGNIWITIIYLIWFAAIWFHLTHGFWSAFQSIGLSNTIWFKRLKVIGIVIVTVLMGGFALTAIYAYLKANGIV